VRSYHCLVSVKQEHVWKGTEKGHSIGKGSTKQGEYDPHAYQESCHHGLARLQWDICQAGMRPSTQVADACEQLVVAD
jgi:hypothetical protein